MGTYRAAIAAKKIYYISSLDTDSVVVTQRILLNLKIMLSKYVTKKGKDTHFLFSRKRKLQTKY